MDDKMREMKLAVVREFLVKHGMLPAWRLAEELLSAIEDVEVTQLLHDMEKDAETHTGEIYGD